MCQVGRYEVLLFDDGAQLVIVVVKSVIHFLLCYTFWQASKAFFLFNALNLNDSVTLRRN